MSYRNGQFVVNALPQGRIGAQITVDLNPSNPRSYPGDLYRWTTFESGARSEPLEIDLWKIIRLRAPQDNGAPLPGWGEDCPQTTATEMTLPLPVSAANEFFLFQLDAKRGERRIGSITTHGLRDGLGWDYRFRVR